jgi:hypothetical protein
MKNQLYIKKLFILLLFLTLRISGSGQNLKTFTPDPVVFFEEMKTFLQETNKEEGENIINEFKAIWTIPGTSEKEVKEEEKLYKEANKVLKDRMKVYPDVKYMPYSHQTGKLSDGQKTAVYRTANTMLKKRMKAFPDFKNYLYTLLSFERTNQSDESFNAWQASLDKLLLLPTRYFSSFIGTCNSIFADNTIYASSSTKWVASNNSYSFDFDSLPKIVFKGIDLRCFSKGDSMIIRNTKGFYYPVKESFYGTGGEADWKRAGMDGSKVYAKLRKYSIEVKGADYVADSVMFYNKNYFTEPTMGRLYDRLVANMTVENASYPRFESYTKRLSLKQIIPGVDYMGGFSMRGNKVFGSGSKEADAYLTFYRNKKPFIVTASKGYLIAKDKITSDITSVKIYFKEDSIYHPGVQLKYLTEKNELSLFGNDEGISKSPYFDSYHQIDMYFDELHWGLKDSLITFKMISKSGEAIFESNNFYKSERYERIQALSDVNPLIQLQAYATKYKTKDILANDLAKYMKLPPETVRLLMISLSNKGFVTYDVDDNIIHVKDRVTFYINAKSNKTDSDVIQFLSNTGPHNNASLNLLNYDLSLMGVAEISLSDAQSVYIQPDKRKIVLKKNRDFTFAGTVHAGRFDIFGKDFFFDYNNFKINLNNVDSLRMKVPQIEAGEKGDHPLVKVKSVLQAITGDLLIDQPYNKSGKVQYPNYPIFNSNKDSYVYYHKGSIQKGVYKKENFYFHLEPFTVDSLDNFTAAGLAFKGTLASANIFPDFKETLVLMPDYSLGFTRETPPSGFPVYKGKANFIAKIKLSHEGLKGDGTLDYLTSTSKSKDFTFFPDSMNTIAESFVNKKQKDSPWVNGKEVFIHYMPYKDRMYVNKRAQQIVMYEAQAFLNGNLELAPSGLTGNGSLSIEESETASRLFDFKENTLRSDTADFSLKAINEVAMAVSTKNVRANIDFTKRYAEFKSNGGGSYVAFPVNQYICFIDQFKWYMDAELIELSSSEAGSGPAAAKGPANIDLAGSDFISTHPQQDSLRFKAPSAKYNLKENIITAEKVPYINVADAIFYPEEGNVIVEKKAKMKPFVNSKLTANSITKFHNFYNVAMTINGRKSYQASGDYDFTDPSKHKQTIKFNKITVDSTIQSYGIGSIGEDSKFTLSPKILYKGDVKLLASKEGLTYSGYGQLVQKCNGLAKTWFSFAGEVDPKVLYIPIADPKDEANGKLSSGIELTNDSTHVYSTFLTKKSKYSDVDIIGSEGYLTFDNTAYEFRIASKEKLQNANLPGNYLSLNDNKCLLFGEGKINLGVSYGQMQMTSLGNGTDNMNDHSTKLNLLMALDFFFTDDALKVFGEDVASVSTLPPTKDNPVYDKGLSELVGKEKADKLIADLNLYGAFKKIPSELQHSLFFSDLKLQWDTKSKSFRSSGPVGLGSIHKIQINKLLKGNVEMVRKRGGDILNIYLEMDNTWYYFNYQRGVLQAISSNAKFNDEINKVKPDKRSIKGDKENFMYMLSTERKKNDFLKKIENGEGEKDTEKDSEKDK